MEEDAEDLLDDFGEFGGFGEEDYGPEFHDSPPYTAKQVVPKVTKTIEAHKKSLDSNFGGSNFFSSLNPKNAYYQIGTGRASSPEERAKAKATPGPEKFDISGEGRLTRENKFSIEKDY